ncbi:MAG: hypothetical protein R6U96_06305 [Promethearchaeia archaeon]
MKRKPIQIMAGLINAFNSFQKGAKYSINEIHEMTDYHWKTVDNYIKLNILVREFSPKLVIDEKTHEIMIEEQSPYFKKLKPLEQLIVFLFISKAFNETSAIPRKEITFLDDSHPTVDEQYKKFINTNSDNALYLTLKGKYKAQGILASIYGEMIDFIEGKSTLKKESPHPWLLNFYGSSSKSYRARRKMDLREAKPTSEKKRKSEDLSSSYQNALNLRREPSKEDELTYSTTESLA